MSPASWANATEYVDWRKKQAPVIVWDDASHKPKLRTELDRIKADEMALDATLICSTACVRRFRRADLPRAFMGC